MAKYVFNVREDICVANNKEDCTASALLSKMAEYGTVEKYEDVMARNNAEYETTIANLVSENNSLKARVVEEDELALLRTHRAVKAKAVEECNKENEALKGKIRSIKLKIASDAARARAANAAVEKSLESLCVED